MLLKIPAGDSACKTKGGHSEPEHEDDNDAQHGSGADAVSDDGDGSADGHQPVRTIMMNMAMATMCGKR